MKTRKNKDHVIVSTARKGGQYRGGYKLEDDDKVLCASDTMHRSIDGTYLELFEICKEHCDEHNGLYVMHGFYPCSKELFLLEDFQLFETRHLFLLFEFCFLIKYADDFISIGMDHFYRTSCSERFLPWPPQLRLFLQDADTNGEYGGQDLLVHFPSLDRMGKYVGGVVGVTESQPAFDALNHFIASCQELSTRLKASIDVSRWYNK